MSDYPPGFWVDKEGILHCDIPVMLEAQGIEATPEAIEEAAAELSSCGDYGCLICREEGWQ